MKRGAEAGSFAPQKKEIAQDKKERTFGDREGLLEQDLYACLDPMGKDPYQSDIK